MKCCHCKGELKKGFVPIHIVRNGWHITLDSVPAWICDQCGEHMLEEKELDAIQDLITTVEQKNDLLKLSA